MWEVGHWVPSEREGSKTTQEETTQVVTEYMGSVSMVMMKVRPVVVVRRIMMECSFIVGEVDVVN